MFIHCSTGLVSLHSLLLVSSPVVPPIPDVHCKGILLVTTHVSITHEVEDIFVGTMSMRGCEVQLYTRLGLQCQALDGDQTNE